MGQAPTPPAAFPQNAVTFPAPVVSAASSELPYQSYGDFPVQGEAIYPNGGNGITIPGNQAGTAANGPGAWMNEAPFFADPRSFGDLVIPSPNQPTTIDANDARIKTIDSIELGPPPAALFSLASSPYTAYRSKQSALSFLIADADQFGWMSWQEDNYLSREATSGLSTNFNIHFLTGPTVADVPPRLFDLEIGYQIRKSPTAFFSYDLRAGAGLYTDFEGSVRDGFRYPSHAVGMFHLGSASDFVFGVDYLSRDDIKILPVIGFTWHNPYKPAWRFEMVFPRPRIDYTLSDKTRLYLRSQIGGGSWDIEEPKGKPEVMTYRDIQILAGLESVSSDSGIAGIEFGYLFNRQMEFRSSPSEIGFDDAFTIRWVRSH